LEFLDNLTRSGQEVTIEGNISKGKSGGGSGKKGTGKKSDIKKELFDDDD
jgi:hypothetical protein